MLPIIDLFAGAGGLSLGASQAGAKVCLLVDSDNSSCRTLKENERYHGGARILNEDVTKISGADLRGLADLSDSDPLIVVGGPPCQPFSKAAYWIEEGKDSRYRQARARGEKIEKPVLPTLPRPDERRTLVQDFFRLVLEAQAEGFIFENVPSLLHPRNKPVFEDLCMRAEEAGYKIAYSTVSAVEYGVAQRRKRVFLLASKAEVPQIPSRTHSIYPAKGDGALLPAVTAREVTEMFSGPEFFEPEEVVNGRWASHLKEIPPGMNYKHHTEWAGHHRPSFVTETRYWNFLLKLDPEQPSWTINASPGPWTGPFHWDSRRLRTLEMAALQGFPPGYKFMGSRRDRVRQIGNAVAVPVAKAMMSSLLRTFR